MKFITSIVLVAIVAMASDVAHADTRTLQVWTCTINAGKSPADLQAVNAKWLKFVNGKVKGGDVRSFVVTPVTGNLEQLMVMDSYPTFEAWAAQLAALSTPEGVAVEAEFNAVTKCTSNSLSSSTES